MHNSTTHSSRNSYRLIAPLYDFVFGFALQHGRRLAVAALDARRGDRILEVGVGSGMSLPMYPRGASVIGIDISTEMLDKARRRIEERDLNRVLVLNMDAGQMDFSDESFDKAVVMYAVSGFPNPAETMAEVQRVCKPGATLVIVNRFASTGPVARFFDIMLAPLFRLLRYRIDLDIDTFLREANLDLLNRKPANLFGYSTVLVCRSQRSPESRPQQALESLDLEDADISVVYKTIANSRL